MTDRRLLILHVEDDPSLRSLARTTLERLGGYQVCSAANGSQALELAREFPPDLFLLDLDLPGLDGTDTLGALRELPGLRDVPVLFLTAVGDAQTKSRLLALGAREVLRKPFRPRDLLNAIRSAIEAPRPAVRE